MPTQKYPSPMAVHRYETTANEPSPNGSMQTVFSAPALVHGSKQPAVLPSVAQTWFGPRSVQLRLRRIEFLGSQ